MTFKFRYLYLPLFCQPQSFWADLSTRRIGYFDRIDEIDLLWNSHTDSDLSHFHLISCVHVLLCSAITCLTHDYKCFGSNELRHRHDFFSVCYIAEDVLELEQNIKTCSDVNDVTKKFTWFYIVKLESKFSIRWLWLTRQIRLWYIKC